MIDVGTRVRLNRAPENGALTMGSGLGTVISNTYDPFGFGPVYVVRLDVGAWLWESGLPYVPTDYHVIAPEYLESA